MNTRALLQLAPALVCFALAGCLAAFGVWLGGSDVWAGLAVLCGWCAHNLFSIGSDDKPEDVR